MLVRRELPFSGNDLITVYRPRTLEELVGNTPVVNSLKNYLSSNKLPHTLLFTGPAGCGKTSAARIIACTLNCTNMQEGNNPCLECDSCVATLSGNNYNVSEINVGKDSGKADVANITDNLSYAPLGGAKAKLVIFDEAHALTTAAKDSLLKVMEDSMSHVYLIFCTNEPEKLKIRGRDDNPFVDRCTQFDFGRLSDADIQALVENIAFFEGVEPAAKIVDYLVELAAGVPRRAIKDLDKVIIEGSWDIVNIKELFGSSTAEDDPKVIELSRAILKQNWPVAKDTLVSCLKHHNPEALRIAVAGYLVGCIKRLKILDSAADRYTKAIDVFTEPLMYDSKTSQHRLFNMALKAIRAMQL